HSSGADLVWNQVCDKEARGTRISFCISRSRLEVLFSCLFAAVEISRREDSRPLVSRRETACSAAYRCVHSAVNQEGPGARQQSRFACMVASAHSLQTYDCSNMTYDG
ncbi:MAG: hypothetical protein ACPIOQ_62210, partial [Promethearchaeia archaeon]